MELNWKSVEEYPKMELVSDDEISFVESNVMNQCLVTDGTFFQEAYMWHIKWKPYETLGDVETLPETWEWLFDERDNPVNQQMWLKFTPTHWVYIKDVKPIK